MVALAAEAVAPLAGGELLEIARRDLVEREAEIGGQDRDVPEHVAELVPERADRHLAEIAAAVAQHLLDLAADLACLAREAQRGIVTRCRSA